MVESIIWILGLGFFGGQIVKRLGIPPLVGMMLVGMALSRVIAPEVLGAADAFRTLAVMVILSKAGLGLDREKLRQQSSVALRLGFLPAVCEAVAVTLAAIKILGFDWQTGLLLGCVLGAESPAVIVPGMLRLKSLGWGVAKGIPDAILIGSALSDVVLLLVFSLLLALLAPGKVESTVYGVSLSPLLLLPLQILLQISLGIGLGWLSAKLLVSLLTRQKWTQTAGQDLLVAASLALLLVVTAEKLPLFSGYLAVMAMGFFLVDMDAPLARRLRGGFDGLWGVAEIFLFALLGASIQVEVLGGNLWSGLLVLAIGTLIGRAIGWYLSTWGSDWTWSERLFLLPGNSAKATVQAAIGAIPLAKGIEGGETILALAVLSILVTAPLGAWAIPTFAPKLLQRGVVDPTKVVLAQQVTLLAAVDLPPAAIPVLTKVAELARRSNAEVLVLHVMQRDDPELIAELGRQIRSILGDIRHRFMIGSGNVPEEVVRLAQTHDVAEIVIGKRSHHAFQGVWMGSVSLAVLENSPIPVVVVEIDQASLVS